MHDETVYELIDLVDSFMDSTDWYRRCLEDVVEGRPVRNLDEAQQGYSRWRQKLVGALETIDPEPADRRVAARVRDGD